MPTNNAKYSPQDNAEGFVVEMIFWIDTLGEMSVHSEPLVTSLNTCSDQ